MSMSFIPQDLMPDVETMEAQFDKMSRDLAAMFPAQFGGDVNLMVQPLAAGAACSALGAGLFGQALGTWMGAVAGSMDAAQKMSGMFLRLELDEEDAPAYKAPKSPARRMMAATETLTEDARDVARSAIDAGGKAVLAIEKDIEKAAVAMAGSEEADTDKMDVANAVRPEPSLDEAAEPDDLKAISGIGPKMEQVLNGLGVQTYAQIAAWGEEEIARMEQHLGFKGRISRDEWLKQAADLMKKTT